MSPTGAVDTVDPRAPRFGQAITALGLGAGVVLQQPVFVFAITAILVVSAVSNWRLDLYGFLWRTVAMRVVDGPAERDAAAPHRFAKLLGATFTTVASVFLVGGTVADIGWLSLAGYATASLVAVLAAVASVFDYCIGCRMYRQVSFLRRRGWV
jgi:hypothetical protein